MSDVVKQVALSLRRRRRLEALLMELRWREYARDPALFFVECIWVPAQGTPQGRVPFELYDYQLETLQQFLGERFTVVLKARQLGLTTLAMGYALWTLLFRPGSKVLLVSKDQRTANTALELLDFMWQFLPRWVKHRAPEQVGDAATSHVWRFPDGMESRIVSLPATKTAGAGETATLVIWDEAALAAEQEDTYRTLLPTTDAGGSLIKFSTARGGHNRFAITYREADKGKSQFAPVFHPWFVSRLLNPKAHLVAGCGVCHGSGHVATGFCKACIDTTIYEQKKSQFKNEPWRFFAEYPSTAEEAFRQSGRNRFPGLPPLEAFAPFEWRGRISQQGMLTPDAEGPLWLNPEFLSGAPAGSKPVIAVDPSQGVGNDFTAMTIGWLGSDGIPVRAGFWHDNLTEPIEASRQAGLLGRHFGAGREALMVIERAGGWGDTLIHELAENLDYRNLYLHRYTGHRRNRRDTVYGFPMTKSRRPLVIDRLADWVPSGDNPGKLVLDGIDPMLRHELGAFVVRDDGKYAADVGMHDDLVMSTAIWLYVVTEEVGAPATEEPKVEQPHVQTFDLTELFGQIEQGWRDNDRRNRREGRQFRRTLQR